MDNLSLYYPDGHEKHYESGHPERPERVEIIRESLIEINWWDEFKPPVGYPQSVLRQYIIQPGLTVSACKQAAILVDTYTTCSRKLALQAASGAASLVSNVWRGMAKRGLALTRPPGHHAMRGQGMGFCLINNIALAAEYLIQMEEANKLAIIDLDLHHGNGTQDIFWSRGDVFYISTHQSPLYPGTGYLADRGAGDGFEKTANFPLPPGSGDVAFITIMDEIIIPLLDRYQPEMLLISYGFDTHWSDPLGQLQLSAEGYRMLIERLTHWESPSGRIALILEGGYNLEAACVCTQGVISALLGIDWHDFLGPARYPEENAWKATIKAAKNLWGL
jgi:acetoin utilization deacetylase AcuC-like enzyme